MEIEIGSVVVLKSGGPKMTVTEIEIKRERGGNGDCSICGPFPRLDNSDAVVAATVLLAQQQWHARHDAHVDLNASSSLTCVWMVAGLHHEATFPTDAVREPTEDDLDYSTEQTLLYRRARRIRRCGHGHHWSPA